MATNVRNDGRIGLKILNQSPLDETGWDATIGPKRGKKQYWVPSRFNVRATTEDGQLILWNTLSSAMSVFKGEQISHVSALLKVSENDISPEGLAGYLIERGFLVRKGTDEYKKFRMMFGNQHYRNDRLELFILPSEDCNFRCTYCYEDFARGTMKPEVRRGIKRLVEQRITHLRVLDIRWFGGEPLYGWDAVEDLGPFFSEIAEKHGVLFASHMTTNGYLLTPEVADKLLAWRINAFQITLDGPAWLHDCSRPTRDGQGSFAQILSNLQAMAKRPDEFAVTLRVNFDENNRKHLGELMDLIEKEFSRDQRFRLSFQPVGKWGGANDEQLAICGHDERESIMHELKALAHRQGFRVATLKDSNSFGGQACYAARPFNLIVGADGQLMKCTIVLDKADHNIVGRITEDGRLHLDDDKMAVWTDAAFESDTQCQKCVVLPMCQGISCPLPRIETDERSCTTTRKHSKKELFEVLEYPSGTRRTREVVNSPRNAGTKGK